MNEQPVGYWMIFPGARRWHYFTADLISLCRSWTTWMLVDVKHTSDDPGNCASCMRALGLEVPKTKRRLTAKEEAFYLGIICALIAVKALHDAEDAAKEIIRMVDLEELVTVAKKNDDLESTGLIEFGYVTAEGAFRKKAEAAP